MGMINRLFKILPKKRIDITEMEWEKERLRRRLAAEEAARGSVKTEGENEMQEEDPKVNGDYEILEREILPERIACPECGNITWEGVERCDKCGKELY